MCEPRALTTGNPADGPETSVLDPRYQREPPTCMTPPGPRLFPVTLGPADHHPDPRDRHQQPPGEPGPDADHRRDRPEGDQRTGDHGPGSHSHRAWREPDRALLARPRAWPRHQRLV